MKWCSRCQREHPREAFARDRSRADGLMVRCKASDRERNRTYYGSNREAAIVRAADVKRRRRMASPPRMCKDGCGREARSSRHWYCKPCGSRHERERARKPRSTLSAAERGYDSRHWAERAKWAKLVARGGVTCSRPECGRVIYPDDKWDLDHTDDRSGYLGPSHRYCNRSAGARKQNALRAGQAMPSRPRPSAPAPRTVIRESARLPGW